MDTIFEMHLASCIFVHHKFKPKHIFNTKEVTIIFVDHYCLWVESAIFFTCYLAQYFIQLFPKKQFPVLDFISIVGIVRMCCMAGWNKNKENAFYPMHCECDPPKYASSSLKGLSGCFGQFLWLHQSLLD